MSYSQHDWWRQAVCIRSTRKSFKIPVIKAPATCKALFSASIICNNWASMLMAHPIYSSPQIDNGYDIADYYAIDPAFGSMADFEQLVSACQQRGLHHYGYGV